MSGALDPTTSAGAHALERLSTEAIAWLTTVDPDGQPQSSPVWFLWRDGEILVYSHRRAHRNGNIEGHPRVAFSLDTASNGDDYVTMEGEARIDTTIGPADGDPAYLAKYGARIAAYGWTTEWFAGEYPYPIRITPTRWRLG